jgi:putative heme-binding domain-containing protein
LTLKPKQHIILILVVIQLVWSPQAVAQDQLSRSGQKLYIKYCGRCHGVVGGGGEGPALNTGYLPRAANDTLLAALVANGIPGTGMPSNWMLGPPDVTAIVHYVRALSSHGGKVIRGDAGKGAKLFQESGCYSCHTINRLGRSMGPDLSSIGSRRGPEFIRVAIQEPGKQKTRDQEGFIAYLVVSVTLRNGRTVTGVRCNEDTFTIQIKDSDNNFYSFRKSDVRSIQRNSEASMMPKITFSEEDLNNIVSFLLTQR